jgi:hypothetical protein
LLSAVGLTGIGLSFPQTAPCPFDGCRGDGCLYQDTVTDSVWYRCPDCGRTGTPIDLAVATWGGPVAAAVAHLAASAGGPTVPTTAVTAYVRWLAERAAVSRLLALAAGRFPRLDADLIALHSDLTAAVGASPARWADRGAAYAVVADRPAVEAVAGKGLFAGAWADAWLIPLYDLPGRVSGVVAVAGERSAVIPAWGDAPHPAGWSAAATVRPDGPVVLACDPVAAVRATVRHLASVAWADPFTCVGCLPGSPAIRWPLTPGRSVTVWAPAITIDVIRHARAVGGLVVAGEYDDGVTAVRRTGGAVWAAALGRRARPWPAAAADLFAALPAGDAAQAAATLSLTVGEWAAVAAWAGRSQRGLVAAARTASRPAAGVLVDGRRVLELADRWEFAPSGELVTDAPFRLLSVSRRGGGLTYSGTVSFAGQTFPFEAAATVFQSNAFTWLRKFLLDGRAATLPYFHPRWGPRAFATAVLMHPPAVA